MNKNQKRMNSLKVIIALALVSIFTFNANSQEKEKSADKTRAFQMTFVTPLGTNGLDAWNITNKFSINLYAGYNGGLDGFEMSGFGSMLRYNMKGTQISGFGNLVLGTGKGVQLAGFFNFVNNSFEGFQGAGFANVVTDTTKACQLAGFANVSTKQVSGAQLAGFANYSRGNSIGQISGFSNVNSGALKGFQISGFANVNTGKTEGVQVAGFANITSTLKGVQVGVFNFVDSLEKGIPIGVFSIVRNGYRAFELSAGETLYGMLSFKTGTRLFYNIISVGASYKNDQMIWGWGYGIGTMFRLNDNWDMATELISYQINENEWFTEALNTHNKLQLTVSRSISDKIEFFGGANWTVNVSETIDHNGDAFKSNISPWNVFNKTYGNDINVKMYPGVVLGIRF